MGNTENRVYDRAVFRGVQNFRVIVRVVNTGMHRLAWMEGSKNRWFDSINWGRVAIVENFETRGFDKTETRNNDSFRESVVCRGRAIIFVDTCANFAHEGRYRNENRKGGWVVYRCVHVRARFHGRSNRFDPLRIVLKFAEKLAVFFFVDRCMNIIVTWSGWSIDFCIDLSDIYRFLKLGWIRV